MNDLTDDNDDDESIQALIDSTSSIINKKNKRSSVNTLDFESLVAGVNAGKRRKQARQQFECEDAQLDASLNADIHRRALYDTQAEHCERKLRYLGIHHLDKCERVFTHTRSVDVSSAFPSHFINKSTPSDLSDFYLNVQTSLRTQSVTNESIQSTDINLSIRDKMMSKLHMNSLWCKYTHHQTARQILFKLMCYSADAFIAGRAFSLLVACISNTHRENALMCVLKPTMKPLHIQYNNNGNGNGNDHNDVSSSWIPTANDFVCTLHHMGARDITSTMPVHTSNDDSHKIHEWRIPTFNLQYLMLLMGYCSELRRLDYSPHQLIVLLQYASAVLIDPVACFAVSYVRDCLFRLVHCLSLYDNDMDENTNHNKHSEKLDNNFFTLVAKAILSPHISTKLCNQVMLLSSMPATSFGYLLSRYAALILFTRIVCTRDDEEQLISAQATSTLKTVQHSIHLMACLLDQYDPAVHSLQSLHSKTIDFDAVKDAIALSAVVCQDAASKMKNDQHFNRIKSRWNSLKSECSNANANSSNVRDYLTFLLNCSRVGVTARYRLDADK